MGLKELKEAKQVSESLGKMVEIDMNVLHFLYDKQL